MANSSINLTSLDFDTIKSDFKNYLKTQSVFKDYNFDGSNMNVLLDILAYNTHLNAFYLNMIASEMFLDSAQKTDSVISHAKELNYVPRSKRSSKAVVSFDIETVGIDNPLIIPKGTIFSGQNSNNSYNFVTDKQTSYLSTNNTYSILELEIYEGNYAQDVFIMDRSNETQKFLLSNPNIDTTSLEITISEDGGSTNSIYTKADNLYGLTFSSNVYFIQASENKKYEIVFGDGVFGYSPKDGAIIFADYRSTYGSESNGIDSFQLNQDLGAVNGGTTFYGTMTTVQSSASGANEESLESIRYNAPKHYQTQGRCITENDYRITVLQNYPEVQYVNVFGGGITNTAVEFGTVYVSPSTYSGISLTESRKIDIQKYLNDLSPVGISAKVVDPEYTFLELDSKIYVNFRNTKKTASELRTNIIQSIVNFNTNNLQQFNSAYRSSKLLEAINNTNSAILSNQTDTVAYKSYTPPNDLVYSISADFQNALIKGSVSSTQFLSYGKMYYLSDNLDGIDSGNGVIYKIELNPNNTTLVYEAVGNVNYNSGIINVSQILYYNTYGALKIKAKTQNQDIYCRKNSILEIDTIAGLKLNIVSE